MLRWLIGQCVSCEAGLGRVVSGMLALGGVLAVQQASGVAAAGGRRRRICGRLERWHGVEDRHSVHASMDAAVTSNMKRFYCC